MASKRRLRRKQCKGKQSFHSETEAARAKHAAIKRGAKGVMNYYLCKWCNLWHIGHAPYNVRMSIAAKLKNKSDKGD